MKSGIVTLCTALPKNHCAMKVAGFALTKYFQNALGEEMETTVKLAEAWLNVP